MTETLRSQFEQSRDCPKCGGLHFGDVAGNCPLSPDYVPSKPWPETTVDDAMRLLRKMEGCSGDAAKLILLKNFGQAAYRAGEIAQREKDAQRLEMLAKSADDGMYGEFGGIALNEAARVVRALEPDTDSKEKRDGLEL